MPRHSRVLVFVDRVDEVGEATVFVYCIEGPIFAPADTLSALPYAILVVDHPWEPIGAQFLDANFSNFTSEDLLISPLYAPQPVQVLITETQMSAAEKLAPGIVLRLDPDFVVDLFSESRPAGAPIQFTRLPEDTRAFRRWCAQLMEPRLG